MNQTSINLVSLGLLIGLTSCGKDNSSQQPSPEDRSSAWTKAQLEVDAAPFLIVQIEDGSAPKVLKSHIASEGFEGELGTDELVVTTENDDSAKDQSAESYFYGAGGSSCFSQSYRTCKPVYSKGNNRVTYAYSSHSQDQKTGRTYIRYKRSTLSYYNKKTNQYQNFSYRNRPSQYKQQEGSSYSYQKLLPHIKDLAFLTPPTVPQSSRVKANFGRSLFHDTSLSKNGQVSCASCHQPDNNFTDGLNVGVGVGQTHRRTPTIVNSFLLNQLFWDGRANSLEEQAKGPIEASLEHGISRGHVAKTILYKYRQTYENIFGPFPIELAKWIEESSNHGALPQSATPNLFDVSDYIWDSIGTRSMRDQIVSNAARNGVDRKDYISRLAWIENNQPAEWIENYNAMPTMVRYQLDLVFNHFAEAVATFERGIVAYESPFDKFAQNLISTNGNVTHAIAASSGFGEKELVGFKLFSGKANCITCHNGKGFSDQKYHNLGLAQHNAVLDIGRAAVIPEGIERREAIGAFRTPTLRNISIGQPFMHDGSHPTLMSVLEHYNSLASTPAVGKIDPILKPLGMTPEELRYIEAFLRSLQSPVIDLNR